MSEAEALLRDIFRAAVDAALPELVVPPHMPDRPKGRVIVLGAGKASAAMAKAAEDIVVDHWGVIPSGLVVTQYGAAVPCRHIEIVEANHPVPDAAGEKAAKRILALASEAESDDLVLFLVSGGGSSLLPLPGGDLTLDDNSSYQQEEMFCSCNNCLLQPCKDYTLVKEQSNSLVIDNNTISCLHYHFSRTICSMEDKKNLICRRTFFLSANMQLYTGI